MPFATSVAPSVALQSPLPTVPVDSIRNSDASVDVVECECHGGQEPVGTPTAKAKKSLNIEKSDLAPPQEKPSARLKIGQDLAQHGTGQPPQIATRLPIPASYAKVDKDKGQCEKLMGVPATKCCESSSCSCSKQVEAKKEQRLLWCPKEKPVTQPSARQHVLAQGIV